MEISNLTMFQESIYSIFSRIFQWHSEVLWGKYMQHEILSVWSFGGSRGNPWIRGFGMKIISPELIHMIHYNNNNDNNNWFSHLHIRLKCIPKKEYDVLVLLTMYVQLSSIVYIPFISHNCATIIYIPLLPID